MAYPNEQPAGPSQPLQGPAPFEGPARTDWRQWVRLEGRPRPWRRSLAVGAGVAVAIAVLGVLLGLLWGWLAPTVPVVKLADSSIVVTDPSPEQYIAADGWFTLLGLGFGLIVTIVSWLVMRRDRGPFLLLGIVGGAFLAGRWVAPLVGEFLGRDAYREWREAAAQGATYLAPPEVQSLGPKLVPAFIAAVVLTLLAGWSNDPDLDQPGAQPGYGPNHLYPPYGPRDADHAPYPPAGDHAPYPPSAGDYSPYAPPTGDQPPQPPARENGAHPSPAGGHAPYPPPAGDYSPYAPPAGEAEPGRSNGGGAGSELPGAPTLDSPGQVLGGAEQQPEPRHPA
ncbi:hypothetical protein Q0Z83_071880 [Actinoplanes sichuanensis]|uniref:DUF2567 domain-containing protein n=1 Tax=Actinoplanes sichuanensis TaxID=512349 RepID=A0ABW4A8Y4_9ACTN|nr:hypothetical protein [Actinoplanes sichuanensis]BEL08997.1 hypothetical protein Q0Z83_071880 [Actinoplanes sichuanensis]